MRRKSGGGIRISRFIDTGYSAKAKTYKAQRTGNFYASQGPTLTVELSGRGLRGILIPKKRWVTRYT